MTWKASKAVVSRCASALAWCRAFVGQFDAKRMKRVEFIASPHRNVVGHGSTRSTYGVPHTITVSLNLECDGGNLMWHETPIRVSRQTLAVSRKAAEQYARAAACRVSDMYVAGVDPEHAAAYLRSHAVDMVHYAHHAKE